MPSPFPGMDPYLESPDEWHSFHTSFITYLASHLNKRLPSEFAAKIEERLYALEDERDIIADLSIRREPIAEKPVLGKFSAILEREAASADIPQFLRVEPLEMREQFIEIIAAHGKRQAVTVIEILSPANKTGEGRRKYLRKQREVLRSGVSLIEIDLLRGGQLTAAIPVVGLRHRPPFDYVVSLNRAGQREQVADWPFLLRDRLPRIHVPLNVGIQDIHADLQEAFDTAYDEGSYSRIIDYTEPVTPPLLPKDFRWAEETLKAASIRA